MPMGTMHWYRSKVDWWLALLLCLPPVVAVCVCFGLYFDNKLSALPIGLGTLVVVAAVYCGLIIPMKYGMNETELLVRFGLCRTRIPLSEIREVNPTHNPLSSPALSLDRLYVRYGQNFFNAVMISPADRAGFLNELVQKTGLHRDGDRLFRE